MYHFIVNPASRSGKGRRIWEEVRKELEKRQLEYTVRFTRYEFHALKLAEEVYYSNPGMKCIVVLGGDGTVNEVINGLPSYHDVLFGYIPSGSSNDLARSMNISKNPLEALERIISGKHIQYLDHGSLIREKQKLPHRFAVSAGMGFDASVSHEALDSNIKRFLNKLKLGKLTYAMIALKQLTRYQTSTCTVTVDQHKPETYNRVLFISAMVHPFEGGGLKMAPAADPKDHKLTICLVHDVSRLKALFLLPCLLIGKHILFQSVTTFHCTRLEVKSADILLTHTDGEYRGRHTHITFSCHPEPLRMLL